MAEEPQEPAADDEAADAEPAQAPIVAELTEEQKKFLVACATGNRVQIELYVNEKSLDPNLQSGTEGLRPLHLTCGAGATDCARLLVEKGAEIAVTDQMGLTPLHWAAGCRDPEVCYRCALPPATAPPPPSPPPRRGSYEKSCSASLAHSLDIRPAPGAQ